MSDNKKYYYLKLKEDFFDSEEMKVLESMKNGIEYQNVYLKMCLLSLKSDGALLFKNMLPYSLEMLSSVLRINIDTVKSAIETFQKIGLITITDTETIYMTDIQTLVGQSSTEAERIRRYRQSLSQKKTEKLEETTKGVQMYNFCTENVQKCTPEIRDKSIEFKDKSTDSITSNSTQHYTSTPTDTLCGSERSTDVSPSSPEPTPFDETSPFDEPSEQVAPQHSAKPNGEQKKSRSSAKGSYPNEYYKTVFDAYMTNYKTLMSTGRLRTPLPKIAIMSIKGTLKKYFDAYGYETILKAVKESVNDDWLVEHGYVFHHIFGERKLLMLINGIKFENKANESKSAYVQRVKSGNINYNEEW